MPLITNPTSTSTFTALPLPLTSSPTPTMSDHDPFPNVKDKLTAPTKKSAFEKSRLEAEAKRLREEAETAAVYKDFVASFDEEPLPTPGSGFPGIRGGSFRGGLRGGPPSGPGRRHFTGLPPSARGGGAVGGPPGRKRNLDAAFERDHDDAGVFSGAGGGLSEREKRRLREGNTGLLAFENSAPLGKSKDQYSDDDSDDETSKPHPKPTLQLTSLPPSTTKPALTALLSTTPLKIDSIRIIPAPPPPGPSQPSPSIRKAASALITLSPETPSSDIDAAVTSLNGRYLGSGFWLSISRHLPSTVINTPALPALATPQSNPFGAKAPLPRRGGLSRAPPPHRGGFAPPSSFAPRVVSGLQVHVYPPQDLKVLRLIHKTIESVLTHGPEFEALLMSSEAVKTDVKFSWLWDARSPEGVYYRWKLWEIVTGSSAAGRVAAVEVFEPSAQIAAIWIPPRKALKYEWAGNLKDVVEDEGFSSEELEDERDDSDKEDEGERPVGLLGGENRRGRGYLGVLERAKLVHLISRIPTQTSRVRRGDIGRVMAFAMEHAEGGMGEEVVAVLVGNVLKPLAFTKAVKTDSSDEDENLPKQTDENENYAAKIIGLWLISDILSNSSLGIRNAWRYRQLFDTALREKRVFAHLGDVYRTPGWGRMKAEKFRRGVVEGVLEWWEKWCIFPQTTQEEFLTAFLNPAEKERSHTLLTAKPSGAVATSIPAAAPAAKSKWKTVEAKPEAFNPESAVQAVVEDEDVDGVPMADDDDDVDGEPMVDEDVDGEPMADEDVDGEPMKEDDADGEPMKDDDEGDQELKDMFDAGSGIGNDTGTEKSGLGSGMVMTGFKMGGTATRGGLAPSGGGPRKRMRAEDMFADDDED